MRGRVYNFLFTVTVIMHEENSNSVANLQAMKCCLFVRAVLVNGGGGGGDGRVVD